jgi:hypothetical protein
LVYFRQLTYIETNLDIITTELVNNIAYVVTRENLLKIFGGRGIEAQLMAKNVFQFLGGKLYLVHDRGSHNHRIDNDPLLG